MKTYELIISRWHAAIPADWQLEVSTGDAAFSSVSGKEIIIEAGAQLRGNGGPEEAVLEAMLEQQFVKEVK